MKKYIVFLVSFAILFVAFQVLSGYVITFFYTPDTTSAWSQVGSLSNSVVMKGNSLLFPFVLTFLALPIAYFITRLFMKTSSK